MEQEGTSNHSREEIDRNLRALQSKLGVPIADIDISLYNALETNLNSIKEGIWNNPAFTTSEIQGTQSEGTYVTDIIIPLLRASLENFPNEKPTHKISIGKRPNVMVMAKYEDKVDSIQVDNLWRKCPSFLETLKKAIDLNADKMASRVVEKSHELQPKKIKASNYTEETNDEDYINYSKKSPTEMLEIEINKTNSEIIDNSKSDAELTDTNQSEEIKKLTQDEVDIRSNLHKIFTACQEKDKKARKDLLTSIYLNNIMNLSDDQIYNQIKKFLNKDRISWLEGIL
ncbi:hypothetical protein Glove_114g61 [Diversispora epigaea]|uniref:Uncharacterized protein n=1 Tax=Diversispora epigaea TaxID=1348612 RepID=A0A397J1B1_9GLOM|nr:hypothetical protein Glove_114g61 [Diversispora epigaea]